MKKTLFTCFGMLIYVLALAQTITVKDEISRQPLEFVTVFDQQLKTTVLTNSAGQVRTELKNDNDSLYFSLMGYETVYITLKQLREQKFRVYLKPGPVMLKPFEISEIRWKQGNSVSPEPMYVITYADIAMQNPQTAADLLSSTGNVFVQKSQLGGGSPMIRGFAANRVLIVVDGVRMNNAIFRSGNLQNVISVDPFNIERAEVIFGPGSVAFGSDAIGGVMSFETFEPGFGATDNPSVYGKVMTRWSSANNEKTAQLSLNYGLKNIAFLTTAGMSDFDDLRMGNNGPDEYLRPHYVRQVDGKDSMFVNPDPLIQKFSGYSANNLMQKIRFSPRKNVDATYTFMVNSTGNIPRYDRLLEYRNSELRHSEWYYGPQFWMMNAVSVLHTETNVAYDKAIYTLALQNFAESRHDRRFRNNWLRTQKETVRVFTVNLDFTKRITQQGLLLYGFESMMNTVGSEASRLNISSGEVQPVGTRYPDGSVWNSFAVYSLYRQQLGKKWNLPVGFRYSHVLASSDFDTTIYPLPFTEASLNTGAFNGSVGLVWRPDNNWQFSINLTTGFRAPNTDDLGKVFESVPGSVVIPNPGLKPEYAYSGNLSITKVLSGKARLDFSGYYTYLNDALVRRDFPLNGADSIIYNGEMSRVQSIQNAAFAYVYGLSANVEVKLPAGFGFSGAFNWQKGEEELDDGSKAPLRHASPVFGLAKLSYGQKKFRSEAYVMFNGSIIAENLAPSEVEKPYMYIPDESGKPWSPSWYTLNIRLAWEVTAFLNITAGVENIADRRYRPYSSGITAPGRNILISATARF